MPPHTDRRDDRGRRAAGPTEIPARGWWDVLVRTLREAKADHVALLAAGVAFFALLALVPALVAVVSVYGLVADPDDVARQVGDALAAAPTEVRDLLTRQLRSVSSGSGDAAALGLVGGLAVALWSASSGVKHLIDALNAAYDEEEDRSFLRVRGLALLLTIGAIGFVVVSVVVLTVVPAVVEGSVLDGAARTAITVARWPFLALAFAGALAVLYRYGPSRDEPKWRWVSPGAAAATALWLVASGGFSLYVSRFGSYDETYGSLGGVVVVMLWLFLTALAVLVGAELDAEAERQTRRDTTEGPDRPLGERGAHTADTVGPAAPEVRARTRERLAADR